jgi:hypothetical protein
VSGCWCSTALTMAGQCSVQAAAASQLFQVALVQGGTRRCPCSLIRDIKLVLMPHHCRSSSVGAAHAPPLRRKLGWSLARSDAVLQLIWQSVPEPACEHTNDLILCAACNGYVLYICNLLHDWPYPHGR